MVIYGLLLLVIVIRWPGRARAASCAARAPGVALAMALLEVRGLTKRFLGVTAVDAVDLAVEAGELVSLIGPNGSGKTTLFNCVTGYPAADGGRVAFRGRDVTGAAAPPRSPGSASARTFQLVSVFPRLTALENLLTFLQQHQEEQLRRRGSCARRGVRRLEAAAVERARHLLDSVGLGGSGRRAGGEPLLRPAQAPRLRRRAHARPRAHPARRAGRRRQSHDDQPDEGAHPRAPPRGQDRRCSSSTTWTW